MNYSNKNLNKEHWNNLNVNYSNVWGKRAKQIMSNWETGFINRYLSIDKPLKLLDIGVGNGRILNNLVEKTNQSSEIYGLDISDNMIDICRNKFKNEPKIKALEVYDVSNIGFCFKETFDFVTAIRCLKYNKDWEDILNKIYLRLNNGGYFIFDALNENSINRFYNYKIPMYRTTKKDLKNKLGEIGFTVNEIISFTKIPDFFYELSNNRTYVSFLIFVESLLSRIFGKTFLGRIFFVCVSK